MRVRLFTFALLTASCGRFRFDDTLDAQVCTSPANHDEDADGIDDNCDVCPQFADPRQEDADGDRAGDACDPNPTVPRERLVVFDPFTSRRPEWDFSSAQPTYAGDAIVVDTRMGQFRADLAGIPGNDTYTFTLRLGGGRAVGFRQIALYALESNFTLYYCDLGMDNSGVGTFQQSYTYDSIAFMHMASTTAVSPIENRDLVMTMNHAPPLLGCTTTWPVGLSTLTGAIPTGIDPVLVALSVIGLEVEVMSFAHIHSD